MRTDKHVDTFLNDDEIVRLTGRKMKSLQITTLKKMGIPFFVSATGHPIVTRAILEGKKEVMRQQNYWQSNALKVI